MLEEAASIATIVGAGGIVIALCEYRHSIKLAKHQDRRASVELAARECAHFGTVVLKEFQEIRIKITNKTTFLSDSKVEVHPNTIRYDISQVSADEMAKMKPMADEALRVFNMLEGFAIPFAEGVADDSVGFVECGRGFVEVVENNLPMLAFTNPRHYYQSTQKLYWRWKKRITKQDLQVEVGKQLVELTEKMANESGGWFERAVARWLKERTGL